MLKMLILIVVVEKKANKQKYHQLDRRDLRFDEII